MGLGELFLLAVGLSMDAFAVSICKGLALGRVRFKQMLIVGLWFGGFQALMPAIGYFLGAQFQEYIVNIDHWVALILLSFIGINMIREALGDEEETDGNLGFKAMLMMAIATSIDALAVGITFAFLKVQLFFAVLFIGLTTFIISTCGVKIGNIFGLKYKAKAEFLGGAILIALGVKILLEHLGFIGM